MSSDNGNGNISTKELNDLYIELNGIFGNMSSCLGELSNLANDMIYPISTRNSDYAERWKDISENFTSVQSASDKVYTTLKERVSTYITKTNQNEAQAESNAANSSKSIDDASQNISSGTSTGVDASGPLNFDFIRENINKNQT